jgi:outer membrane protein OmpA-like peptidoglycan-associated protein
VALLKTNLAYKLSIEGHTDSVGGAEPNLKLSEARAATVVAELVKAGIAATRLSSAGAGLTKPLATNETSDGRAKNRRVELVKR